MAQKHLLITAVTVCAGLFIAIHIFSGTFIVHRVFITGKHVSDVGYPVKVAVLIFATGNYIKFAEVFISSMRKYFDCPICNVTYVVFSDKTLKHPADDILLIPYQLIGWPYDTLKRVHAFQNSKDVLDHFDYLLSIDADMRARSRIGMEMLGDLMATLHPGFYHNKNKGPYENNTRSSAYVGPSEGGHYFAGGFYGAKSNEFWELTNSVSKLVDEDLSQNYIAIWHDESYLNRYFITHPPTIILSPAYCSPERWSLPYEQKIVARAKRHSVARA